jgi:hypothetical protein
MANVPTPEFQKFWSNQIESLGLEYGDAIQHPDTNTVIERLRGVLIAIARLADVPLLQSEKVRNRF